MPIDLELGLSILTAICMPIDLELESIREKLKSGCLEILKSSCCETQVVLLKEILKSSCLEIPKSSCREILKSSYCHTHGILLSYSGQVAMLRLCDLVAKLHNESHPYVLCFPSCAQDPS